MPTYRVEANGQTFRVNSPGPLTDEQVWSAVQPQADKVRADQVEQEEAGKAAGGQYKLGPEGLRDAARQVGEQGGPVERAVGNVALGLHTTGEALKPILKLALKSPAYELWKNRPAALGGEVAKPGPEDEELRRQKEIKKGFAEDIPGGEYYQMAGETLPAFAVPAGGAGGLVARVAGRTLPRTLAARAGDVALTGGLTGAALTPGGAEERLKGAAGGALGGAVPLATGMGKGVFRMARGLGGGAGREAGLAERMARDLGEAKTAELVQKLDAPSDEFARAGVQRPTAAQVTRDPTLQQMETGLRVQRPDLFHAIDEAASQGRWDKLTEIAQNEQALAAKVGERATATNPMREGALAAARDVPEFAAPVAQAAESIMTGESRTNPQARTLAKWVAGELEQGVTPEQLYTMRKTLTLGIPHGTELGAAMSQARRERMALVEAIDNALDSASGGQWKPYLAKFEELSGPVTEMKAGQAIQKTFETTPSRTSAGTPVITAGALRRALAKHGEKQFGSTVKQRVSPEARSTIEAIAGSVEAQDAARMAQGTIGSRTAGNIAASDRVIDQITRGAMHAAGGGMVPHLAVDAAHAALGHVSKRARQQAYADLLADPQRLKQALQAAALTARREDKLAELARTTRAAAPFMGSY